MHIKGSQSIGGNIAMFSAELARLQRQVEEASNMLHSERQTPQILSAVATPLSRHRSTETAREHCSWAHIAVFSCLGEQNTTSIYFWQSYRVNGRNEHRQATHYGKHIPPFPEDAKDIAEPEL